MYTYFRMFTMSKKEIMIIYINKSRDEKEVEEALSSGWSINAINDIWVEGRHAVSVYHLEREE